MKFLLQLKLASDCGIMIPTTLCSNDPEEIRLFCIQNEVCEVIYRPLSGVGGLKKMFSVIVSVDESEPRALASGFLRQNGHGSVEAGEMMTETQKITCLDLAMHQSLYRTPGIFQKMSRKQYALRVTCFGHHLVAAKLNLGSQQQAIEPCVLPDDLAIKIRMFMHTLRAAFGTCDFIVTPDHEYIFLDVNEQIHYKCSTLKSYREHNGGVYDER